MAKIKSQLIKIIGLSVFIILLLGCATNKPRSPQDPLEPLNRKTFAFNQQFDKIVYRPIAQLYDFVVPQFMHKRVTNFFSNLGEVTIITNDILQADVKHTASDTARFLVNTSIGLLGVSDPASHLGLTYHYEDFGLTLAKWGVVNSPYFVIPFLGPSTLRDTIGLPINYYTSIPPYIEPDGVSYSLTGLNLVNQRANLLTVDQLINQAFDPYVFVRNAYLQKRRKLINSNTSKKPST